MVKVKPLIKIKNYIKSNPKKTGLKTFLILVILGVIGYFGYTFFTKPKKIVAQNMNANPTVTPSKTPDGAPVSTPGANTITPASTSMTPTVVSSAVSTPMAQ